MAMIAGSAMALVVVSVLADRRRQRRRDIEAVGIVPWPLITILSVLVALFAIAFAIKDLGG